MRFYLIDDSPNIINILKIIIHERELGQVCGSAENAVDALEDLPVLRPDIVVVDLLMPEMDGITFVQKAREILPEAAYIMLSQVTSKDMVADAYNSGIEFFLHKPVNSIEVENVIRRVCQSVSMRKTLSQVHTLVQRMPRPQSVAAPSPGAAPPPPGNGVVSGVRQRAENLLRCIGILGAAGSRDIIDLVCYLTEHPEAKSLSVSALCGRVGNAKTVEQRIRRAEFTGLVNLASLGLEDYNNEIFTEYASTLYRFEQVRKEMNYISGKGTARGKVQLNQFLSALVSYSAGEYY